MLPSIKSNAIPSRYLYIFVWFVFVISSSNNLLSFNLSRRAFLVLSFILHKHWLINFRILLFIYFELFRGSVALFTPEYDEVCLILCIAREVVTRKLKCFYRQYKYWPEHWFSYHTARIGVAVVRACCYLPLFWCYFQENFNNNTNSRALLQLFRTFSNLNTTF